jgi:hypothetical protein
VPIYFALHLHLHDFLCSSVATIKTKASNADLIQGQEGLRPCLVLQMGRDNNCVEPKN